MTQEPNITKIAFSIIRNPETTVEQARELHGLSDADTNKLETRIKSIRATVQRMAQEFFPNQQS